MSPLHLLKKCLSWRLVVQSLLSSTALHHCILFFIRPFLTLYQNYLPKQHVCTVLCVNSLITEHVYYRRAVKEPDSRFRCH